MQKLVLVMTLICPAIAMAQSNTVTLSDCSTAIVAQTGQGNQTTITQSGQGNTSTVIQHGTGNRSLIRQSGSTTITHNQEGNQCDASIQQTNVSGQIIIRQMP